MIARIRFGARLVVTLQQWLERGTVIRQQRVAVTVRPVVRIDEDMGQLPRDQSTHTGGPTGDIRQVLHHLLERGKHPLRWHTLGGCVAREPQHSAANAVGGGDEVITVGQ